jgi:large subunit ribosomal protein L39e
MTPLRPVPSAGERLCLGSQREGVLGWLFVVVCQRLPLSWLVCRWNQPGHPRVRVGFRERVAQKPPRPHSPKPGSQHGEGGLPAPRGPPRGALLTPPPPLPPPLFSQPSQKTFRTKRTLAKKQNQNRPIPHWIRMRTDNKIR